MPGAAYFHEAVIFLQLLERELLLFAAFWFLVGALDDLGMDLCWIWLRITGRAGDGRISARDQAAPLSGSIAVLIAAWQEEEVISHTIRHALSVWQQDDFTLYVGCYGNDPATVAAAMSGASGDSRVRVVIHEHAGPTTKADCLNRLYTALCEDERRYGNRFRSVVLHDSEDMVHPAELAVIDTGLGQFDFVQIPVRPEPQETSHWVAGHYTDEFAESHGKAMVVRNALGAALPAAGVGCGFRREMLGRVARRRMAAGESGPFAIDCLTEDYELGLLVAREGGSSHFLRVRDAQGGLVATRAYFPGDLAAAVRQKTRWIHGIAFQGWDRLGWGSGLAEKWMVLRDRRGPLTAVVLAAGYALVLIEGLLGLARLAGLGGITAPSPVLQGMLSLCFASLVWRAVNRFAFTAAEYGIAEGIRSVLRIPVANVITIMAGRRALGRYVGALKGDAVAWDKTRHTGHPALALARSGAAS